MSTLPQTAFERDIGCRKIDGHWHLGSWGLGERRLGWDEIRKDFDRYGYIHAVVSSIQAITYDLAAGNEETFRFLDCEPRAWGLVVVHPTKPSLSQEQIRKYCRHPRFAGLKLAADYYGTTIADPRCAEFLRLADQGGWPVLTHKHDMVKVAGRYPGIRFIVAHSHIADVRLLAEFSNVHFDICASYTHRVETDLEAMVATAGVGRVLYGTDAQVMCPSWSIGKVSSARLSCEEKEHIYWKNAWQLFRHFESGAFSLERTSSK